MSEREAGQGEKDQKDEKDPAPASKWWHKAGFVTLLTGFIGALVPLTTGVQTYVQKEKEIQLEREKHQQSVRLHYLDILTGSSLKDVEMFLSFISDTDDSPDLRKWAQAQLGTVRGRIESLENDLTAAQKRADDAEKETQAAKATADQKLKAAQAQANASKAQKEQAEQAAQAAQAALAEAQKRAEARRADVLDRSDHLRGRRSRPAAAPATTASASAE
jgi:hypothetical protein